MRHSLIEKRNPEFKDWSKEMPTGDNIAFLETVKRSLPKGYSWLAAIGMVGGKSLASYALRHAQAVLRWDRRPSYWSHCFLIAQEKKVLRETTVWECTIEPRTPVDVSPERNGVIAQDLGSYQDHEQYPNVAVISFRLTAKEVDRLLERARDANIDRLRFNLWELLGRWQSYVWGIGQALNPLAEGVRMPAAAYVEMAYEAVGIDLTPGASERNSSPEHFWQTALWWWQAFEKLKKPLRIDHCVREKQALILPPMTTRLPREEGK